MGLVLSTSDLDKIETIRAQAASAYDQFRGNSDLSGTAILKGIARAYVGAKQQLDALQGQTTAQAATDLDKLISAAFGIDDLVGGDPVNRAAVSMSYRDALDRAAATETPQGLRALFEQANETGDDLLARAVARTAWAQGIYGAGDVGGEILALYKAKRPRAAEALDTLAQTSQIKQSALDLLAFALPLPDELRQYRHDYVIEQLANS
jgi:phage tail sheath gpL-like